MIKNTLNNRTLDYRSLFSLNFSRFNILKLPVLFNSMAAAFDQGILSLLSFFISILLVKNVAKIEYGYYSIGFTVTLFVLSVQQAIVNTPLAVLLIEKKQKQKFSYVGSLCYGQFYLVIPTVCLALAVIVTLSFFKFDSTQTWIAASVCFALVGTLLREFLRAYLFAEESPLQVLKMDSIYIVLLLISILISYFFFKINVSMIFILIGSIGLIAGFYSIQGRGWQFSKQSIKESYRQNWKFGKWALFGGIVTYVQSHGYIYILAALLGSVAVAEVSAARLLIMPMIFFRAGWSSIVIPRGSRFREQNQLNRFFKEQVIVTILYVIIVLIYAVVLFSLSDVLQNFLFTQKYVDAFVYFPYWVAINIVGFFGMNAGFGLQVTKNFAIMSKLSFFSMLVTLISAYFLISVHGIMGGLAALIIGDSLLGIVLWGFFFKSVFSSATAQSNVSQKIAD
jgi:O-antigen/teichoic acid export membrane protein